MAKTKVEEVEVDETENKAREIGKQMGAVEDKNPEEEEEYEIEASDDEDDDRKLGKNKERDESGAEKRAEREKLSNREKRHLRNKKRHEKFAEKDQRIAAAEERARAAEEKAAKLEEWRKETDSRLHGINKSEVERAFNEAQRTFQIAEQDSLTAFSEGDGVRHLRAIQAMKEADDRMKLLRDTYAKLGDTETKQSVQEEDTRPKHDPRVVNQANKWASRNDWYDPSGADEDSAIAKALAGVLANEGWDPTNKDFWDELDERLEAKLQTGKKNQNEDEDEDFEEEEEEDIRPQKKRRAAPPVNGSTKRGDSLNGKKTIRLPTAYVERMKREAPEIWNDPKRRKKLLDDRARILRESGEQ